MKNLKPYESDASEIRGSVGDVIIPKNILELRSAVLKSSRIVPRGAGTGLSGGAVPNPQDTVIDLSKLNKIENLDVERKTIEVDAGVILDDLQDYLDEFGLEFPVNPSSHSVCTIGGMISTNAVGSRAVKYGKTSQWVRWIEVIDGKGNVNRKGITELSDYVGLEGITGIISRACLNLSRKIHRTASLVSIKDFSKAVSIVKSLKSDSSVSMIELVDKRISSWIGLEEEYNLIIEYESSAGILQGDEYEDLMRKRDEIYPLLAKEGYTLIEDPKLMLDKIDKLIFWLESHEVPFFGHLSVGIIHPCFKESQKRYLNEFMGLVKRLGGQVSGEHGIGLLKKEFVEVNDKKILINIKKRTDPQNKFNLGKVI